MEMDSFFFEYRAHFLKNIKQIELNAYEHEIPAIDKPPIETPDTSVCVRIRPITEHEKKNKHIQGVFEHSNGVVHIYEPRRRVNGKPELNVRQSYL
jgi:kinesin family protein 2/24